MYFNINFHVELIIKAWLCYMFSSQDEQKSIFTLQIKKDHDSNNIKI